MSRPSTPPIAAQVRTYRCSVCSAEHELYGGDDPKGRCIVFEAFHAIRGAQIFCVCHDCSTTVVGAWARVRGTLLESEASKREQPPVVACPGCGSPIVAGDLCRTCIEAE